MGDVALVETGGEAVLQERLAAGVHVAFADVVAHHVGLLGAGAAEGVVAAAEVLGDGHQHVAVLRHQLGALGEVDVALGGDGVDGGVAIGEIVGVVEKRVGGLIAFQIDHAHRLALLHNAAEAVAGQHGDIQYRTHRQHLAVSSKPRPFSGRDTRQISSGPGGGTRFTVTLTGLGA